jgi:hypothetical protein
MGLDRPTTSKATKGRARGHRSGLSRGVPLVVVEDRGSSSRRIALDPTGVRASAHGDEMRFVGSSHRHDRLNGLRTRKQIALSAERDQALKIRAERREAEARVRHLNFELVAKVVLLASAVGISIAVIIGSTGNPTLLRFSLAASGGWGVIAAGLARMLRPKIQNSTK